MPIILAFLVAAKAVSRVVHRMKKEIVQIIQVERVSLQDKVIKLF